jgi:acyl-CoA synthetase (AMP-forming)/AMP-acid ligase II
MSCKYDFNEFDKFYQVSDLTFDLSVQDLFLCWKVGACLCASDDNTITAIPKFIKDKKLTVWFSVPSVAILFSKMRLLKPAAFPSLRYSMFCGEALPSLIAEAWQLAAPDSTVINFYGPTETTIAITHYEWNKNKQNNNCINGIVPLGKIFETQECCIIDDNFNPVEKNIIGELCLSGSQASVGYYKNIENTKNNFIKIPAKPDNTWYRTGDRVMADENDCLYFFGRTDNEVKIKGYRVNLLEVDNTIRRLSTASMVATIAVLDTIDGFNKLISFISSSDNGDNKSEVEILNHCKQFLPAYMMPEKIMFIDEMPLNSNGKIDRHELLEKYRKL